MKHQAHTTPNLKVPTGSRRVTGPALPPGPDGRTTRRAAAAAVALDAFRHHTGAEPEDAACDLLADLMHWCDRHGASFANELHRARTHYAAETDDFDKAKPGRGHESPQSAIRS